MIRKLLLLALIAAAPIVGLAATFKPTAGPPRTPALVANQPDARSNKKISLSPTAATAVVNLPRGGAANLKKSDVITIHSWVALSFGVMFALESFGISFPVVGLAANFSNVSLNSFTAFLMRLLACLQVFAFLMEKDHASTGQMSKFFDIYHALLTVPSVLLAKDCAKTDIGKVMSLVPVGFFVAGLAANT